MFSFDASCAIYRGFAFMTFKTVEAARRALADPNKTIEAYSFLIQSTVLSSSKVVYSLT